MPKRSTTTTAIDTISKTKAITKPKKYSKTLLNEPPTSSGASLDLCLLMDCTSSMQEWIERSKETLHEIINNIKAQSKDLKVRVAFVGYRDIRDTERFCVAPFTSDLDKVKSFISKQVADGGRDWPEDVQGGLN
jgi:hypothetical protein